MGNQSVIKNHTGSVKVLATIVPQVCGSFSRSNQRGRGAPIGPSRPALSPEIMSRSASLTRGCSRGTKYMRRHTTSQTNPSNPGSMNTGRQPHRKKIGSIRKGATAPPMEDPLSNKAVARVRSRFGNHSETALVAPGQLADSPAPSKKRNVAKLEMLLANEVMSETIEYHV